MLTIPLTVPDPSRPPASNTQTRVLVIGRSENVLIETVDILVANGLTAGATNDFDNVLTLFDATSLTLVVFGGMVPPDVKENLRTRLRTANPELGFVQGLAGIPGLVAAQVQAAVASGKANGISVSYDGDNRVLTLSLRESQPIQVVGFWATALTPPEPKSATEVLFDQVLPAGNHSVPLSPSFPTVASFIAVHAGADVDTFTVGPMPRMDILPPPGQARERQLP